MRTDDMNEHSHSSGSQRDANESEDNPHLYKRRWLSAALLPSLDFHWRDPLFPAWTWRDGRRLRTARDAAIPQPMAGPRPRHLAASLAWGSRRALRRLMLLRVLRVHGAWPNCGLTSNWATQAVHTVSTATPAIPWQGATPAVVWEGASPAIKYQGATPAQKWQE